jgi:nitrite reductase/ring-hydroxylating ferredoxin subunit
LVDGKLVDGSCVVCPWHGSTFDMRTGEVIHGPSPYPQPAYEAREQQGNIEVRLKR